MIEIPLCRHYSIAHPFILCETTPAREHRLVDIETLDRKILEATLAQELGDPYLGVAVTRTNACEQRAA